MTKVVKLRSEVIEWKRKLVTYEKYQQLHEYLTNLDENLDTSSFGSAKQVYLDPKRLFTLIKVVKLRCKGKKSVAQSIQL